MENFVRPSVYFADMSSDRLLFAADPDVRLSFVAVADIGTAATAAFAESWRFHGLELELAGDVLSFREAAGILSDVLGTAIELPARPVPVEGHLAAFSAGTAVHECASGTRAARIRREPGPADDALPPVGDDHPARSR